MDGWETSKFVDLCPSHRCTAYALQTHVYPQAHSFDKRYLDLGNPDALLLFPRFTNEAVGSTDFCSSQLLSYKKTTPQIPSPLPSPLAIGRRAIPAPHLLQHSGERGPATRLGSTIELALDVGVAGEPTRGQELALTLACWLVDKEKTPSSPSLHPFVPSSPAVYGKWESCPWGS